MSLIDVICDRIFPTSGRKGVQVPVHDTGGSRVDTAAHGDGAASLAPAIAAAKDPLIPATGIRLSPDVYEVAADLTIDVPVVVAPGAMLRPALGVTIRLDNQPEAPEDLHWLDCSQGGHIRGLNLVHAKWFGVKADAPISSALTGSETDDTDAVYAGILALEEGGEYVLPRGGIRMTQPFVCPRQTMTRGRGIWKSAIRANHAGHGLITGWKADRDGETDLQDIKIRGFTVRGPNDGTGGHGAVLIHCKFLSMSDMFFTGFRNTDVFGRPAFGMLLTGNPTVIGEETDAIRGTFYCTFNNVRSENNSWGGGLVGKFGVGQPNTTFINDSTFKNNIVGGLYLENANANRVSGGSVEFQPIGVRIGNGSVGNLFTGNLRFEKNSTWAIQVLDYDPDTLVPIPDADLKTRGNAFVDCFHSAAPTIDIPGWGARSAEYDRTRTSMNGSRVDTVFARDDNAPHHFVIASGRSVTQRVIFALADAFRGNRFQLEKDSTNNIIFRVLDAFPTAGGTWRERLTWIRNGDNIYRTGGSAASHLFQNHSGASDLFSIAQDGVRSERAFRFRGEIFIPAGETTPSVATGNLYRTNNSSATSITNFTNSLGTGHVLYLRIADNFTTLIHGTGTDNIVTKAGADITAQGVYAFLRTNSRWYQL